jgi:hypothetical protein
VTYDFCQLESSPKHRVELPDGRIFDILHFFNSTIGWIAPNLEFSGLSQHVSIVLHISYLQVIDVADHSLDLLV